MKPSCVVFIFTGFFEATTIFFTWTSISKLYFVGYTGITWWGELSVPELDYNLVLTYFNIDTVLIRIGKKYSSV